MRRVLLALLLTLLWANSAHAELLLYVNFELGAPGGSTYTLGTTEYSAGSDSVTISAASINSTGAIVGDYGVQHGGFGHNVSVAVSSGDIFDRNTGRAGFWVEFGGGDDSPLFIAVGSDLQVETRSNGAVRLRWAGDVIINTADFGETLPTNYTQRFVEVKWDRTNNLRAVRISSNSTEGTWRENTSAWSEPAAATAVLLGTNGAGANMRTDNWLISDDPDENLYDLRNLEDYGDYGDAPGPRRGLLLGVGR